MLAARRTCFVASVCCCFALSKPGSRTPKKAAEPLHISVEGWRFIPHSYAQVNQNQLLHLLKRTDVRVTVQDAPYLKPWSVQFV